MASLRLFAFRTSESGVVDLAYGLFVGTLVFAWVMWDRRYRDKWHAFHTRNWPRVEGRFDEGEVVQMMKGRSQELAGYKVYLGYEYQAEGEQFGLYTTAEMKEKDDAEAVLKKLAHQRVPVRFAPGKPSKSRVVLEDMLGLLEI